MSERAVFAQGIPLTEFTEMFNQQGPFELIEGEMVFVNASVSVHARLSKRLFLLLHPFEAAGLGEVFQEATFVIQDKPDWVTGSRIPDVMFVPQEQLETHYAKPDWQTRPFAVIPSLVIEIVSPNDRYTDINRKVRLYLQDGVNLVWVIDPQEQHIAVHAQGTETITMLRGDDKLTGDDALPDFSILVSEIFKDL